MAMLDMILRLFKKYVCNLEFILVVFVIVLIHNFICHDTVTCFFGIVDKIKVYLSNVVETVLGPIDSVQLPNSNAERVDKKITSGAFWEFNKPNVGVFAIQGRRPYMEDRFNVIRNLNESGISIYGVFDGHGGEFAAEFTEKMLFKMVMTSLLTKTYQPDNGHLAKLLQNKFLEADDKLLQIQSSGYDESGSTAILAIQVGSKLTVANVGDSRAVVCDKNGSAVPLSFDHKPQMLKERKRIKQAGGFISFNGVWRVAGILATSRAFGDPSLKEKKFVIAEPDVLHFDMEEMKAQFMILASDGLWDVFSSQEAVTFIQEHLHEKDYGARSLVLEAYYKGSYDNITVVVTKFDWPTIPTPGPNGDS